MKVCLRLVELSVRDDGTGVSRRQARDGRCATAASPASSIRRSGSAAPPAARLRHSGARPCRPARSGCRTAPASHPAPSARLWSRAMRQSGRARMFARMMSKGAAARTARAPYPCETTAWNRAGAAVVDPRIRRRRAHRHRIIVGRHHTPAGARFQGAKPEDGRPAPHIQHMRAPRRRGIAEWPPAREGILRSSDAFPIRRPAPPRPEAASLPAAAAPRHARHRPRTGRCGVAGRRPGSRQASRARQAARSPPTARRCRRRRMTAPADLDGAASGPRRTAPRSASRRRRCEDATSRRRPEVRRTPSRTRPPDRRVQRGVELQRDRMKTGHGAALGLADEAGHHLLAAGPVEGDFQLVTIDMMTTSPMPNFWWKTRSPVANSALLPVGR